MDPNEMLNDIAIDAGAHVLLQQFPSEKYIIAPTALIQFIEKTTAMRPVSITRRVTDLQAPAAQVHQPLQTLLLLILCLNTTWHKAHVQYDTPLGGDSADKFYTSSK